jgi:hypothetical protein
VRSLFHAGHEIKRRGNSLQRSESSTLCEETKIAERESEFLYLSGIQHKGKNFWGFADLNHVLSKIRQSSGDDLSGNRAVHIGK